MTRIPMSPVAAALLRALIRRANVSRDRILLTDARSVAGSKTQEVANQVCAGLDECEFSIPAIVADGSMLLTIEALTVADD